MRIVAFIGHQSLGDFIRLHLLAASAASAFPNSKLGIIYRDDRPYKDLITRLNPYVTLVQKIPDNENVVFPLDLLDGRAPGPDSPLNEAWHEHGFHKPDLLMTPSMLGGYCSAAAYGPTPRFMFPDDLTDDMRKSLIERGLDPDRWFACLHMRESTYVYRRGVSARSVAPASYVPMIHEIIKKQGGQVVRVGDPDMTPLPEIEGLIDLALVPGTFPEQVFATSRARYYIGTDSGPIHLASAFRVPAASTNATAMGVWNPGEVILTKRKFILSDGVELSPKEMCHIMDGFPSWPEEIVPQSNTPEELCLVAEKMFQLTQDCSGWRDLWNDEYPLGLGSLVIPRQRKPLVESPGVIWM